jgi:DUF4097 and DUF4098 domain-containing protein YvlB
MDPIRITATSGRIEVTAEDRADVQVDKGQRHPMGGILEVQSSSSGVTVRVPLGTDLVVGSHSGSIRVHGRCGNVRVTTRSGKVEVEECASVDARAVSGRVTIGTVTGDARVKTASGRVTVDRVGGDVSVTTVSGRIDVGTASGAVTAHTVNGRVEISLDRAADVRADSVSGSVKVALPSDVRPEVSLVSVSGRCDCDLPEGEDCSVTGRSVSGRVEVVARR